MVELLADTRQRLATLDKVCRFSCEEYRDLKRSVERYKANGLANDAEAIVALPPGRGGIKQWEIRPPTELSIPFLLRGYLAVDGSGNALLAIFRGDPRRNVSFHEPWSGSLSKTSPSAIAL